MISMGKHAMIFTPAARKWPHNNGCRLVQK